jgi:IclR family KDG regulon transcriptional repressor
MATVVFGEPRSKTRYSVDAVSKAFDILQVFIDSKKESLALGEITTLVKLNKNAVFRLLFTMAEKGFLKKDEENGRYSLSPKCIELARVARLANDLRTVALAYMRRLREQFEDTVNLAILEHGQIRYIEVLESSQRFKIVANPGERDPVHCTALGKAMLAHLPEHEVKTILELRGMTKFTGTTITTQSRLIEELAKVRRRGYAINDGEMVEASRCVAVPILNTSKEPVAAISISGPVARMADSRVAEIGMQLLQCAAEISNRVE